VGLVELVSQELDVTVRVGAPATPTRRALDDEDPFLQLVEVCVDGGNQVAVSHQFEARASDVASRHRRQGALP